MSRNNPFSKLVYSTNPEEQPEPESLLPEEFPPFSEQKVRVFLDRKGRKGKTMTVAEGIQASEEDRKAWVKDLKKKCGSGGSITEDGFQIQGENVEKIKPYLEQLGFTVRK